MPGGAVGGAGRHRAAGWPAGMGPLPWLILTHAQTGDEIVAIGGNTVLGRSADIVAMLKACNSVLLTVRPSSELLFQVNPELKKEVRLTQDCTSFKLMISIPRIEHPD